MRTPPLEPLPSGRPDPMSAGRRVREVTPNVVDIYSASILSRLSSPRAAAAAARTVSDDNGVRTLST